MEQDSPRIGRVEELIASMTPDEKAQVLQQVVQELGGVVPGVETHPDVAGGEPCLARMRIPVWVLVQAKTLGVSEADLLRSYPDLRAEDLVHAWAYHRLHPDEVERQIRANEAA